MAARAYRSLVSAKKSQAVIIRWKNKGNLNELTTVIYKWRERCRQDRIDEVYTSLLRRGDIHIFEPWNQPVIKPLRFWTISLFVSSAFNVKPVRCPSGLLQIKSRIRRAMIPVFWPLLRCFLVNQTEQASRARFYSLTQYWKPLVMQKRFKIITQADLGSGWRCTALMITSICGYERWYRSGFRMMGTLLTLWSKCICLSDREWSDRSVVSPRLDCLPATFGFASVTNMPCTECGRTQLPRVLHRPERNDRKLEVVSRTLAFFVQWSGNIRERLDIRLNHTFEYANMNREPGQQATQTTAILLRQF